MSAAYSAHASQCVIEGAHRLERVLDTFAVETTPGDAGEPGSVQLSAEAVKVISELGERLTATAYGHDRRSATAQILVE